MAEFEQTENVEIQGGEPPVKSLYNTLKNDKEYGHIFSTYTPEEFESNLKSNKEAATSLKQIAIQKGIYKTDKDFDVAIFGSKPQAPAKAPAETKQPKEEKGWIRSAVTDGVPGLLAKFASSPVGQSLGRTVGQTKEITGEPVKKKEATTGIVYGERTPLDDYEQIQQEYIDIDKKYQDVLQKSKRPQGGRLESIGLTREYPSQELIKARDEKRRKSDAILAKASPEIESWVQNIIGDAQLGVPGKVSTSLDLNKKTSLPRGLYINNAGNITVDDAVTDKLAKEEVSKRGLPENGIVYKLLKNALDRRLPYEIARPYIEKEAATNFFKENGISISNAKAQDFAKQLGGTESEQRALNETTTKLGQKIFAERDAKINEINLGLKTLQDVDKKKMDEDEEGMAAYNNVRQQVIDKYQDLVNKGELSVEEANAYINSDQVNEAANRARNETLQKKYGPKMKEDYDKYLSSFGAINSRYKARYEREAKEAEVFANAQLDKRVAEMKAKYKPSDAFIGKFRKAYDAASTKYYKDKEAKEVARESGADAVDRISRGLISSLGDGIRSLGQSFNVPDAEQFGEVLSSNFKGANIKLKPGAEGWKQALNPFDPAAQQGFAQLIGRMYPALATSAAVGAATGGLGASTLGSAIAAGFAGGVMETADIAGTIYNDVLEQTGSLVKATQARDAAVKSQIQIAPVYALDAFAYFPKLFRGMKFGKSVLGRTLYGGVTEYTTEMLQELPQNVYEELIRKGVADDNPYDPSIGSMLANINGERINETGKQLTGTILLGGAPSLFQGAGEEIRNQLAKRAAQAYYAKNVLTNASHPALMLENQSQFLQKVFDKKGKNFANAMIGTFLINGNLTKEQAKALVTKMENYEKFNQALAKNKRQNINPLAKQAEFTLFDKWMTAIASKNKEAEKVAFEKYQNFVFGNGADLLLVRLADGSTNVYTYDDFDTLLNNDKMQDLVRQKGFEVVPFSQVPNDPQVAALNEKLQSIVESAPQANLEKEESGFTAPDDEKILEGQKRTGYQVVSPLANLPQEISDALQAASENREGFDPQAVLDASNYLYRLYNITTNLKKSTTRNLTKAQIADQMEELGTALDLLGNYHNRLATGEMDIQEQVQQDEATQTQEPQQAPTPAPPQMGTPQIKVLTNDEVISRMTEQERDMYYDLVLDGNMAAAEDMIRVLRNESLKAEQRMGEVRDAAEMVQNALRESGIEVTMVDSPEEYGKLVQQHGGSSQNTSQGMFFGDDGKIYINRALLQGRDATVVIWHEGTHPILNIIRNTNPELYNKVISGLKKAAEKNKQIAAIIQNEKSREIDPARADDESLTETIAQIADGTIALKDIPLALRDALVELINKIAAAFGLPKIRVSDVAAFKRTAKDIADVLQNKKKLEDLVGAENIREYKDSIGQGGQARTKPYSGGVEVVNGFYSPIEKRLSETNIDKQSANKWLTGGVIGKGDEAIWTGVRAWLESKNPQEQVSKSEIQKWMKDNRIQVREVVKGRIVTKEDAERKGFKIEQVGDRWVATAPNDEYDFVKMENSTLDALLMSLAPDLNTKDATKFSEYQLEGEKSNYKEVVIVLPREGKMKEIGDYKVPYAHQYGEDLADNRRLVHLRMNTRDSQIQNKDYLDPKTHKPNFDTGFELIDNGDNYQVKKLGSSSPYFNTYSKKILSDNNMSVNDLKDYLMEYDRLGKEHPDFQNNKKNIPIKVLFLEEVQSDWGQTGKKEGFKKEVKPSDIEILSDEPTYYDDEKRSMRNEVRMKIKGFSEVDNGAYFPAKETLEQAKERWAKSYSEVMGTPTAPFVTDTNAWTKLGLKVALREAVKQGVDKIAWTTGEQQNDRYDLSEQINSASAIKNNDGTYNLVVEDKQGNEIDPYSRSGKRVTPQEMEDVVGKDLAKKLIEGADRNKGREWKKNMPINPEFYTVSGLDLKVGGKGMIGFYGSPSEGNLGIVGSVAKSLFKQEPGTVEINNTTQNSIDITPELKEEVSRGLPQFRKSTTPFGQLDAALELSPVKSKAARAELIEEYGKQRIDQMIEITRNFEKIINGLEEKDIVTKDCP